jgi:hypothetical protein
MKPYKLLLILCILISAIYAASPLWLSFIIARQLPPGWQLEKLEAGYPGFTGIDIKLLQVMGNLWTVEMALAATDIRFTYQGLKTDVGSLTLDIYRQATKSNIDDALTIDDLSLPVTNLTGKYPQLSVSRLQVVLHHAINTEPGNIVATQPLTLNFQALKLRAREDNGLRLTSQISIEGSGAVDGWLDVVTGTDYLKATILSAVSKSSSPWLNVSLEQTAQNLKTTTRVQAVLDAGSADQEWLDSALLQGTGGILTHLNGKLTVQADFAGKEFQVVEHLSLAAEHLQATFDDGFLIIDAEFLASREDANIMVTLPKPVEIQYQDMAGRISKLIASIVPGLQRSPMPIAMAHAELAATSRFVIQPDTVPSVEFSGDMTLGLTSSETHVSLQATDLQVEIGDFYRLDSSTAKGLITLNWAESAAFTYTSDDLSLKADNLSFSSTGNLQISHQKVDFKQTSEVAIQLRNIQTRQKVGQDWLELNSDHYVMQGRLNFDLLVTEPDAPVNFDFDGQVTATHPLLSLSSDEHSAATTIVANELSITGKLVSGNDMLVNTGESTFIDGQIFPMATSASITDITWQELDLINLAGKLSTKTQGFATKIDNETWTGFDLDLTYTLFSNSDVRGSGSVMFDFGLDMPIAFAGNIQAEHWNVSLPTSSIKLPQLGSLMHVAHFELPESIKLTEGYIDIQGNVVVGDEITAKMTVSGYEMGASMLESNASEASFTFNTSYGNTISASGPVSIEFVALAGGIDVSHIRADLNVEAADTIELKNLYAEVFDGQLNLDKLRFSKNRIEETALKLSHIDLGHLLEFVDIDGLEGTGILNILLPAGSDEEGVHIKNGTFTSTKPGRLVFASEGMAGSNIGLQALENFHYQELSGTLDYQSNGDYQITIHLDGKNPDLYEGHPIVFNLNINGSLPEFFEALFITGSFEESILNQIRTDY